MMKFVIVICITLFAWSANAGQTGISLRYEELFDQLMRLKTDPANAATVKDLWIQRDVAKFHLEEGMLYLCQPIGGRVFAAVFLGKGTMSYQPPTEVEQEQLYRFYEVKSLNKEFNMFFMIFADTTLQELRRTLTFNRVPQEDEGQSEIEYSMTYMADKSSKTFDASVMKMLLENAYNDLFYAVISAKRGNPVIFGIDPYREEEVFLKNKASGYFLKRWAEVINQFYAQKYYSSKDTSLPENKDFISVSHYNIVSKIERGFDFSSMADITFEPKFDNQSALYFVLYGELEVDSVFWGDGSRADYFKGDEGWILWVKSDSSLRKDQSYSLRVYYQGRMFDTDEDGEGWIGMKSSSLWYPKYPSHDKAKFDITFYTPSNLSLVSVGQRLEVSTENDVTKSRWVSSKPIYGASFNIGYFRESVVHEEGVPPVTVYVSDIGHHNLSEDVGSDIGAGIKFFTSLFGKPSLTHLCAVEIPFPHGEAFPGLIHLSSQTFRNNSSSGWNEYFRAHEVAHQWWGISVDFRTYHDQWLNEAFASYSGLMFMQSLLNDNDKFFEMLKSWKERILSNRKYLFGSGQEAGPISLGYRTESSKTEGDYNLIIYSKGAWVLHMLRNMMIDLRSMKEDRFKDMMRDYYTSFMDKEATTADFQKIVEKHIGMDMKWFFRQWVDDIKIPTYQFAYTFEKTTDDKFKIHCKVKQSNVGKDFQMYVPIYIDFGENMFLRTRMLVKGEESEFDIPPLSFEPKNIIFNDLESVLCEVEYIDWD